MVMYAAGKMPCTTSNSTKRAFAWRKSREFIPRPSRMAIQLLSDRYEDSNAFGNRELPSMIWVSGTCRSRDMLMNRRHMSVLACSHVPGNLAHSSEKEMMGNQVWMLR